MKKSWTDSVMVEARNLDADRQEQVQSVTYTGDGRPGMYGMGAMLGALTKGTHGDPLLEAINHGSPAHRLALVQRMLDELDEGKLPSPTLLHLLELSSKGIRGNEGIASARFVVGQVDLKNTQVQIWEQGFASGMIGASAAREFVKKLIQPFSKQAEEQFPQYYGRALPGGNWQLLSPTTRRQDLQMTRNEWKDALHADASVLASDQLFEKIEDAINFIVKVSSRSISEKLIDAKESITSRSYQTPAGQAKTWFDILEKEHRLRVGSISSTPIPSKEFV